MLPQVHLNFGPTSFDRAYQLFLPMIPGGVFTGGLLLARPALAAPLRSTFHPYAGIAAFVFAAYIAGFFLFVVSGLLTGMVTGVTQVFVFRSWTPARSSYFLSQCTIWRQVAAKFLGELAPMLPENPSPTSVMEKIMRPMKNLTEKRQNDELWEEWYRILQDYLLRDTPFFSNDVMFVLATVHATTWAVVILGFVNPHVRHWWVYVPGTILILFGAFSPFLVTLSYLSSERLSYWDFTARLLAEIRGRTVLAADTTETPPSEGA